MNVLSVSNSEVFDYVLMHQNKSFSVFAIIHNTILFRRNEENRIVISLIVFFLCLSKVDDIITFRGTFHAQNIQGRNQ